MRHRRADPICRYHLKPFTRWGDRRSRGRSCPACMGGGGMNAADRFAVGLFVGLLLGALAQFGMTELLGLAS